MMRLANIAGRAAVVTGAGAADIERASAGRFSSDPQSVFDDWEQFKCWARSFPWKFEPHDERQLGATVPDPVRFSR